MKFIHVSEMKKYFENSNFQPIYSPSYPIPIDKLRREEIGRLGRHGSIRKKLQGTPERPRLSVHRSSKNIYVQLIDDTAGKTLVAASSKEISASGGKTKKAQAAAEVGKLAAQKALNNESSLSILYSLQEFAETVDWVRFVEMFKDAPQDIKTIIYNLHKERIITEVSQGNAKLFRILENAEHNKVFKSKGLINHIIENHDEILAKDFVGWFYDLPSMEDKRDLYFVFLSNPWLLNLLLDNIRGDKIRISRSAEMIQELIEDIGKMAAEKEGYNEATEERLLEGLYEFLDNKPNIDTSRALKIIKKLPATKNPKILLLRVLIRYEIGDNSEFISLIKEEDYKQLIQDLTKGGLKAIDWEKHKKAFQEIKPKSFFRWIL